MIAKRGVDATEDLLRSWMANDPEILNSDGELLAVIAAGDCDLGLTNHYYLGRALDEDPDFPVAPGVARPGRRRRARQRVGRRGGRRGPTSPTEAIAAHRVPRRRPKAQESFTAGGEFAANPEVPPPTHIADWADVEDRPDRRRTRRARCSTRPPSSMLDVGWR